MTSTKYVMDIELTPMLAGIWSLDNKHARIDPRMVYQRQYMLSMAIKPLGVDGKHTKLFILTDYGLPSKGYGPAELEKAEGKMMKDIHKHLLKVDYLIGHNMGGFDRKHLNTFLMKHKLPPLPCEVLDTLTMIKQVAKLPSNRLGDVTVEFNLATKMPGMGYHKLLSFALGTAFKSDWDMLGKYNKQDVIANEPLHDLLVPFVKSYPNDSSDVVSNNGGKPVCPRCMSDNLIRHGHYSLTSGRKRQRYRCKSCGYFPSSRMSEPINSNVLK